MMEKVDKQTQLKRNFFSWFHEKDLRNKFVYNTDFVYNTGKKTSQYK